MRRILGALEREGDLDTREIAEAAHCSLKTLTGSGYLRRLVDAELIRVARYVRQTRSGPAAPIYSITPGANAQRPKPFTVAEKSKRWKKRAGYRSAAWKAQRSTTESLSQLAGIFSGRNRNEQA
jgi:hypothetical protein